ncbi:DUF177 domain-containing protein [Lapidilactobacillus achengensis]|uniref:DUF177 domain-containing protein n=1 Tax=Lapidilactobacillus achengensis TaxID=2486000 RepID=A0ABW1UQT0_9LACO|nr:DUF177 domain-containing protein [Lapidilactobacillus achengensis]
MTLRFPIDQLQKYQRKAIQIDETLMPETSLKQRYPQLIGASAFQVTGTLQAEGEGWRSRLQVSGQLTVPSTRSLAPVALPLDLRIDELYLDQELAVAELEEDEATPTESNEDIIIPIVNGEIDLASAIEDNLLLAIPTQIYTPAEAAGEALPTGEGWEVLSEADFAAAAAAQANQPNPEFAKLKLLLDQQAQATDQPDDQEDESKE